MQIKGIKRGKNIELFEEIKIADGSEILIDGYKPVESGESGFWEALVKFRQETDLESEPIEPEDFEGIRNSSPGREVNL